MSDTKYPKSGNLSRRRDDLDRVIYSDMDRLMDFLNEESKRLEEEAKKNEAKTGIDVLRES